MSTDYLSIFKGVEERCDRFEQRVSRVFFDGKKSKESVPSNYCKTTHYQEMLSPIKVCAKLCEILKPHSLPKEIDLNSEVLALEDFSVKKWKTFELTLNVVRSILSLVKEEILALCSALDGEERERMNEAIHTYFEVCNYSCVAMSVSAVESRLLKLMHIAAPESEKQLEKKTLGQLMSEYIDNKEKYKHVVPEKNEPLLELCNIYRTFSVHPKKQKITGRIANSILSLAIEFLTDQDTKPEIVKAQRIAPRSD